MIGLLADPDQHLSAAAIVPDMIGHGADFSFLATRRRGGIKIFASARLADSGRDKRGKTAKRLYSFAPEITVRPQHQGIEIITVVDAFEAIDQRTTLKRDAALIDTNFGLA